MNKQTGLTLSNLNFLDNKKTQGFTKQNILNAALNVFRELEDREQTKQILIAISQRYAEQESDYIKC